MCWELTCFNCISVKMYLLYAPIAETISVVYSESDSIEYSDSDEHRNVTII